MRPPTASERAGLRSLLGSYLDFADGDIPLVVFTEACVTEASWVLSALRDRGLPVSLIAARDARDTGLRARLASEVAAAAAAAARRVVVVTLEDDLLAALADGGFPETPPGAPVTLARIADCVPESFSLGLAASAHAVRRADDQLAARLGSGRQVKLETEGGACLDVELADEAGWRGSLPPDPAGAVLTLPAGGVQAQSACLNGVFRASGALTVNRALNADMRLANCLVTVVLADSRVTSVSCANPALDVFLRRAVRIGDTGRADLVTIGGNPGVTRYLSASNQLNVRRPGLHLTLGAHIHPCGPAKSSGTIRIDVSTPGGRVVADSGSFDPCDPG